MAMMAIMNKIGRQTPVFRSLKELEHVLNNKAESFPNKVESLIEVWKQVSEYHLTDHKQHIAHLMDWLKLHTLNIVLTGDWKKVKDTYEKRLLKEVKHCEMLLSHSNNIFSLRCRKLAEVINDPWGSPVLSRLLNETDINIGTEEMDFFSMETGYLISTRLRKLCESHCEDMALNLVTAFMRCYQLAEIKNSSLNATEDQKRFILDVYIALLYKYKKTSLIISKLKTLTLQEGLDLLKRFVHKRVNIFKIWRHSNRIAHLAAQVYVTAAVMKTAEEDADVLQGLLETWFSLNDTVENLDSLKSAIRRIIQAADSAVQMYIFCDAVHKQFGSSMKTFAIELYIRALTTDMNDLERQKSGDDDSKVFLTTKRLSMGFLSLADVLEENLKVSRECVLTSFSLQPTQETLDRIVKLAKASGYPVLDTGQSWKCKLHPPALPSDEISFKCESCGDYMSQPQLEAPINTNMALNEALSAEHLGLSSQLCDDLVVVLSSPRYQLFNWLLPWRDLHTLCVIYLNDPERTKNLVTELKFVDIDYSVFMTMKREPEDEELTGIERGYECYLEEDLYPEERISSSSSDEDYVCHDSRSCNLGSDGTEENSKFLPQPTKKNPDVLKTLRLFRKNLKRTIPLQNELPSKVFVTAPTSSNISPSHNYFTPSTEDYSCFRNAGTYNRNFTKPDETVLDFSNYNRNNFLVPQNEQGNFARDLRVDNTLKNDNTNCLNLVTNNSSSSNQSNQFYNNLQKNLSLFLGQQPVTKNVKTNCANLSVNSSKSESLNLTTNKQNESKRTQSSTSVTNELVERKIRTKEFETKLSKCTQSSTVSKSEIEQNFFKKQFEAKGFQFTPIPSPTVAASEIVGKKMEEQLSVRTQSNLTELKICKDLEIKLLEHTKAPVVLSTELINKRFEEKHSRKLTNQSEKVGPKMAPSSSAPRPAVSIKDKIKPRVLNFDFEKKGTTVLTTETKIPNDFKRVLAKGTPEVLTKNETEQNILSDDFEKVRTKGRPVVSTKKETEQNILSGDFEKVLTKGRPAGSTKKETEQNILSDDFEKGRPAVLTKNETEQNTTSDNFEEKVSKFMQNSFRTKEKGKIRNQDLEKKISELVKKSTLMRDELRKEDVEDKVSQLPVPKDQDLKNEKVSLTAPIVEPKIVNVDSEEKSHREKVCTELETIILGQVRDTKEVGKELSEDLGNKSVELKCVSENLRLCKDENADGSENFCISNPKVNLETNCENVEASGTKTSNVEDACRKLISCVKPKVANDQIRGGLLEEETKAESKNLLNFASSGCENKNQCLQQDLPVKRLDLDKNLNFFYKNRTKTKNNHTISVLYKQFNIKELSVILQRVVLPRNKKTIKVSRFLKQMPIKKNYKLRKTTRSENKEISLNKSEKVDRNGFCKPWPLQDINPKVNFKSTRPKNGILMNPCVLLKRLEFEDGDKRRSQNSILSAIPGLNDLQMIRPSSVDRIVQVVQVPGSRCTTSVPIPSTQTSTQVSPHIQRIGQPRNEKCERSAPDATSTTNTINTVSTAASESPTLINILSQQIIRPSNQSSLNAKPRSSPLINILSQQIIKPATSTSSATKVQATTNEVQVNNIPRVISGSEQIINQLVNPVRAPVPALKTLVSSPSSDQNRIVQFICKSSDGKLIPVTSFTSNKVVKVSMTQTVNTSTASNSEESSTKIIQTTSNTKTESDNSDTLPKFQQAFGKATYQNNADSSECTIVSSDTDVEKVEVKCEPPKNSSGSLNVQPVQGGVIYTRQMPVAQTINLLPPGRGQVFRIATSNAEQLSFVKDTVIHGKMSALLAAALQGKQRTVVESNETDSNADDNTQTATKVALTTRPMLVQSARIVKPVIQIPSNVIRTAPQSQSSNLSSTTLEQLREFDMVYKQVKERSSGSAPIEASPQSDSNESTQQISVTYLNQNQKISCAPVVVVSSYCSVQPAASPSLSVTSQGSSSPCVTPAPTLSLTKVATKSPKPKSIKSTTTHASKASPIPKPQQKPQEDEHTTQRIFDILAEYAEQLRNSPDLNNKPAPRRRSNPPTNPNQNAKRKKSSSSKKSGHCSNSLTSDGDADDSHTVESEDSSCGVVQISMQDDEQPNCSEANETCAASPKPIIVTDTTTTTQTQSRSLVITDSNVSGTLKMSNTAVLVPGNYIMPVSMVKGGQQIAVVSGGSKILATVPARAGPNMLLFQSFLNQTKKPTNIPTLKYSTVQPISGITRNVTNITQVPSTTTISNQNLTAVTLSQTVALQKVNQMENSNRQNFETELLLTIAHQPDVKSKDETQVKDKEVEKKNFQFQEKLINTSVATSVIAQPISIKEGLLKDQATKNQTVMALNLNSSENDKDATIKVQGRVQSVLVATGTSNGPMLSNSPPSFNKQSDCTNSDSNKDEYLHNDGKQRSSGDTKSLQTNVYSYQGKIKKIPINSQRLDRDLHHLTLQRKQAALERELHLQKSLSEECEDLGVDEPSTSDLFPEADLLFDSNHSPSFDQTSQDIVKRHSINEAKDDNKNIGLFCDDEPIRSDFLFEPLEYPNSTIELEYNRSRDVPKRPGEAGYLNEDTTLLQTCTTMSDVTIPSPISPDSYTDNSPQQLNKCKFKYTNRKKAERKQVENWPLELSSSEDTTGSTELAKSCSRSPEDYPNKVGCDEEYYGFTIVERLPIKEDEEGCQESHCKKNNCSSGRGARRSVKKLCSCCNGSADITRKPNTPITHKKSVFAKKR